jgi:beta-lactamase regulating signal transducer with metallopeptidase domain
MSFFYSFTETLLHSLWQSALLLIAYAGITAVAKQMHPLQKRNALYLLIAAQLLFSAVTFFLFATNSSFHQISIAKLLNAGNEGLVSTYAPFAFYAWLLVAITKSGIILKQWFSFKKKLAESFIRPSADLKVFTQLKSYHLGIKRKVSLWLSENIASPITYGFFKPVILLPFSLLNDISQEEAEAIILHELAHIKSRDYLLNWLLVATEIIYFFNPFIKIIAHKIRLEREKNCDVQVINFEYAPVTYAQVLLRIAKRRHELRSFQLAAAKRSSQLLQRVRFFSVEENFQFNKLRSGIMALPAILIIAVSAFFFLPKTKEIKIVPATAAVTGTTTSELSQPVIHTAEFETGQNSISRAAAIAIPDKTYGLQDVEDENITVDENAVKENELAMHAGLKEIADSVKEFTYKIETKQGKITQTFKLSFVKGQWIFEPLWMLTETRPDSLQILVSKDSIQ